MKSSSGLAQPDVKMELCIPIPPHTPSPTFQSGQQKYGVMRLPVPLQSLKTETISMILNPTGVQVVPSPKILVKSSPVLVKFSPILVKFSPLPVKSSPILMKLIGKLN